MNQLRSINPEDTRQSTESLHIEPSEQAELFNQLSELDESLEQSPFVIPDWTRMALKSIPLRRPKHSVPGAYMNIESGAKQQGNTQRLTHASITITDKSKPVGRAQNLYALNPGAELWESWSQPRQTEPNAIYNNPDFIEVLDSQIPDELFESLYDKIPTGSEIVALLAGHLEKAAKTRTRAKRYSTTDLIIGEDYAGARTTEFLVRAQNKRIHRALLISATHESSYGPIKETIGYATLSDSKKMHEAGGFVRLEADLAVPQARLDAYAIGRDQAGLSLDVLHQARQDIANYYLPQSGGNTPHTNRAA